MQSLKDLYPYRIDVTPDSKEAIQLALWLANEYVYSQDYIVFLNKQFRFKDQNIAMMAKFHL